jgi:hypothetical protein
MKIAFLNENYKKVAPTLDVGPGDIDIDESKCRVTIKDDFNLTLVTFSLSDFNKMLNSSQIMIEVLQKQIDNNKDFTIILRLNKSAHKQDITLEGEAEDDLGKKYSLSILNPCKVTFEYKKGNEIIYEIK